MIGENGTPETPEWELPRRALADGCTGCSYSLVYCDSFMDVAGERCCRDCRHPEVTS